MDTKKNVTNNTDLPTIALTQEVMIDEKKVAYPMITESFNIPQSQSFVMNRLLDTDTFCRSIVPKSYKEGGRIQGENGQVGTVYEYYYWQYVGGQYQYSGHSEKRTFTFRIKEITKSTLMFTKINSCSSDNLFSKLPKEYDFMYKVYNNNDAPKEDDDNCTLVMWYPETSQFRILPMILFGILTVAIVPSIVYSMKANMVKQEEQGRCHALNYLSDCEAFGVQSEP